MTPRATTNRNAIKTKTITLTVEQWEFIEDTLSMAQDTGPEGSGWKSDELIAAQRALRDALEDAKPE